jgi:hypothetical protein
MLFVLMIDFVRSRKGVMMELLRGTPFVARCRVSSKGGRKVYTMIMIWLLCEMTKGE